MGARCGAEAKCSQLYQPMTKTNDLASEVLRDAKHPFRGIDNRPKKSQKHRYERRKVREFLKPEAWIGDDIE